MYYESIMEKLLDEDNDEVIELQPEGGEVVRFEQIGVVVFDGTPYAVMHPVLDKYQDDEVVVFRMDPDDEDSMELVMDEALANKVVEVYNNDNEAE